MTRCSSTIGRDTAVIVAIGKTGFAIATGTSAKTKMPGRPIRTPRCGVAWNVAAIVTATSMTAFSQSRFAMPPVIDGSPTCVWNGSKRLNDVTLPAKSANDSAT
jgi:hypothetical protein